MEEKDPHFIHVFWYITGLSGLIMIYLFAATFIPLHDSAVRFVDSNIGYLQNILVAIVSYFVGATVQKGKAKNTSDSGITIPSAEKTVITTENKSDELG